MGRAASVPLGIGTAVAAAVLGAGVSLCAVALHGYWWGLVLGLAATAATLVALPGGPGRLGFAVGWAFLLGAVAPQRSEGDYVVGSDLAGYVLLGAGVLVFMSGFVGLIHRPATGAGRSRDAGRVEPAP